MTAQNELSYQIENAVQSMVKSRVESEMSVLRRWLHGFKWLGIFPPLKAMGSHVEDHHNHAHSYLDFAEALGYTVNNPHSSSEWPDTSCWGDCFGNTGREREVHLALVIHSNGKFREYTHMFSEFSSVSECMVMQFVHDNRDVLAGLPPICGPHRWEHEIFSYVETGGNDFYWPSFTWTNGGLTLDFVSQTGEGLALITLPV